MVNATTLARVKTFLGGDPGNDTLLSVFIDAVSREIEAHIGYPLAQAARTEQYDLDQNDQILFLKVVPVASVAEVKIGPSYWDFTGISALIADQDYRLGRDGQVYLNVTVQEGFQKAQVIYTAGLGTTDTAVAAAAPSLALAADMQVAEEWRRRDNPQTVTRPGPKGATVLASSLTFLPRVEELLAGHRRILFV